VRKIFAALEGRLAKLDCLNKPGFLCQIAADRLLRKNIRVGLVGWPVPRADVAAQA